MQTLLKNDADILDRDFKERTPLSVAAEQGNICYIIKTIFLLLSPFLFLDLFLCLRLTAKRKKPKLFFCIYSTFTQIKKVIAQPN